MILARTRYRATPRRAVNFIDRTIDADGTALASHTPSYSALNIGWTAVGTPNNTISSNRIAVNGTAGYGNGNHNYLDLGFPNQVLSLTCTVKPTAGKGLFGLRSGNHRMVAGSLFGFWGIANLDSNIVADVSDAGPACADGDRVVFFVDSDGTGHLIVNGVTAATHPHADLNMSTATRWEITGAQSETLLRITDVEIGVR